MLPISVTTRPPRPSEVDGVHYRFVDDAAFDVLEHQGAFLESATVHGHRYGTPRAEVERALAGGATVVLEIDVQGARAVRTARPDATLIFIDPPDEATLERRLAGRGTEGRESVEVRLRNALAERAAASEFDHRVVNDRLDAAVEAVIRILESPTREPD